MHSAIKVQLAFLALMALPLLGGLSFAPLLFVTDRPDEVWRLVTAHAVHLDTGHWFWNWFGGAVLLEVLRQERQLKALWASVPAIVLIDLYLLTGFELAFYGGLSGVLNTWMVLALYHRYHSTHSWIIVGIAVGYVGKLWVELSSADALFQATDWQSTPVVHVLGAVAGLLYITGTHLRAR